MGSRFRSIRGAIVGGGVAIIVASLLFVALEAVLLDKYSQEKRDLIANVIFWGFLSVGIFHNWFGKIGGHLIAFVENSFLRIIGFAIAGAFIALIAHYFFFEVALVPGLAWDNKDTMLKQGATAGGVIGGLIGILYSLAETALEWGKRKSEMHKQELAVAKNEQSARDEIERQRALKSAQEREANERERASLLRISATLDNIPSGIEQKLENASAHLDNAEYDFSDGAFAPFWEQIEEAALNLVYYNNGLNSIKPLIAEYTVGAVDFELPKYEFPLGKIVDARPVADRMAEIVRRSQKNYEFSSIFEQRKTNAILISGFGNLLSAVGNMHDSISSAFGEVANTLDVRMGKLLAVTEEVRNESLDQSEMLHNIQWRQKPPH